MRFRSRSLLASLILLFVAGSAPCQDQAKPIRVLFIGNSYTYFNDLPQMISALAKAGNQRPLEHARETPGGWSLEQHFKSDKTLKKIADGKWDYVVLQEQSLRPLKDRKLLFEYAAKLDAEIKKHGAKTLLYQTWSRQDAPEKQAELSKAFVDLGKELGAKVIPVGEAWARALKDDPKLVLHNADKSHPNKAGSYLAACVFYAAIYGKSPEGLPGEIGGLSNEAARKLQAVAWQTVATPVEKERAKQAKTDLLGDPLPEGAIARLGTSRLIQPRSFALRFSPDDKLLAALDHTGTVSIWDVSTGKGIRHFRTPQFRGYSSASEPLAFSPDSKLIALACADRSLRVWEVATGKEVRHFTTPPCTGSHIRFDPSGRYLAVANVKQAVSMWDVSTGDHVAEWGDGGSWGDFAFSADGKTILTVGFGEQQGKGREFVFWDVATKKERSHQSVRLVSASNWPLTRDGSLCAALTLDANTVVLVDPTAGKEIRRLTDQSEFRVRTTCLSGDGRHLATTTTDGMVRVWSTGAGEPLHKFRGATAQVERTAMSSDGSLLALSGRADAAIHIWDVAKGKEMHVFLGHRGGPVDITFDADGKTLTSVSRDSSHTTPVRDWSDWSMRRWDVGAGKERAAFRQSPEGEVHLTAFSPDGRLLATVNHEGTLRLFDVPAGKEVRSWTVPTQTGLIDGKIKFARLTLHDLVFSADGATLLAGDGAKIRRWSVADGKPLPELDAPAGLVIYYRILPSPDKQRLLVSNQGRNTWRIVLLDTANNRPVWDIDVGRTQIRPFAFSPDGKTLASCQGKKILLWDSESGSTRGHFDVETTGYLSAVAFSPDGRFLAAADWHNETTLRVWHLASGKQVGQLEAMREGATVLRFSPDSKRLASAGYENTVLVWNAEKLAQRAPAPGHLSERELRTLWGDLTGPDGARALRAIHWLAESAELSVPFVRGRLHGTVPRAPRLAKLIEELGSETFRIREQATRELEKIGPEMRAELRDVLRSKIPLEVKRRVEKVLEKLDDPKERALPSPESITLRCIEVLELSGTPKARQVLEEIANGLTDSLATQEARASLVRMRQRP
jgi:WD40 repeat protein